MGSGIDLIDLFCGLGGLTYGALEGLRRAGLTGRLALAIDSNAEALGVLKATLPEAEERIREADLSILNPVGAATRAEELKLFGSGGDADSILLAGPPCQGHSALNNHTRHDDDRNSLYLAVARAVELIEPVAVLIENVNGISADRRGAMELCAAQLRALGYEVVERSINLHLLGVPQRRFRHVLVATRRRPFEWDLPAPPGRDVAWAIEDLLDSEGSRPLDTASVPSAENRERINWLFTAKRYDLPNDKRPPCHRSEHSYLSMYGRLRWDRPAQTVTSGFGSMGQGRFVHPLRRRTLTPHEAARLQCVPDYVDFSEVEVRRTILARMIGNVAPPLLSVRVVEGLAEQGLI